ncbi:MAG: hypothetical protein CBB97_12645 [Candidatus Endolissoclinum sp. TMED37]|nr:MAG: hypothetical protein CBB97_12645 [Candidatus Endolissoclinum sp. TMED37]
MRKNCVILPIETTSRELNSKILLACQLATKNIPVLLGTKNYARKASYFLNNSVFIDKGYHKDISEDIYKNLKFNGCSIVLLDEEGMDYEDFRLLDERITNQIIPIFDKIFLLGKFQKNYLKKNRTNYREEKFIISGNPRFDLLDKKFTKLFKDKAEKIKRKHKDFILFATDNKLSNNINTREHVYNNYKSRIPDIKKLFEYGDKLFIENIRLIKKIYKNTDFNIVVRPHPEENKNKYEDFLKDFKDRVRVIYEDSSIYWVFASSCVIVNHSTTAIEGYVLKKKILAYIPIKLKKNMFPYLPISCSEKHASSKTLLSSLCTHNFKKSKKKEYLLRENLNIGKGSKLSIQIITDVLIKNYNFKIDLFEKVKMNILQYIIMFLDFKSFLKANIFNVKKDKLSSNKLSDMNSQFISKRFDEISKFIDSKENLSLKKIGNELYLIKKKRNLSNYLKNNLHFR